MGRISKAAVYQLETQMVDFLNRCFASVIAATLLLLVAGCGANLENQRELTVTSNDIRSIIVDPVSYDQTIKVWAVAEGSPINVHVHLAGDEEAVDSDLALKKSSDKVLAGQFNSSDIALEARIPADKEAVIRVQGNGAGESTVKLTIEN